MGVWEGVDEPVNRVIPSFFSLAPLAQMVFGAALSACGALVAVYLYLNEVIAVLPVFATGLGAVLVLNGWGIRKRRRAFEAQVDILKAEGEEIMREVNRARAAGSDAVEFLVRKGITDFCLRQAVLREARKQQGRWRQSPAGQERGEGAEKGMSTCFPQAAAVAKKYTHPLFPCPG